jgi:DNA-binding PadR family transcriptional regulator
MKRQRQQLAGHLDLLLLSVLGGAPQHGYAIIGALRERSGGELDVPEGTVYPALHRLEESGLVRSRWAEVDGRRRRVYQLSAAGSRALVERRNEWRSFAATVDAVLGWSA